MKRILICLLILNLACMSSSLVIPAQSAVVEKSATQACCVRAGGAGMITPLPEDLAFDELAYAESGRQFVVCAREFLNVRGGPGIAYPVLYQIAAGKQIRVREWIHNGWAMIKAAEWVNGDYLCRP